MDEIREENGKEVSGIQAAFFVLLSLGLFIGWMYGLNWLSTIIP